MDQKRFLFTMLLALVLLCGFAAAASYRWVLMDLQRLPVEQVTAMVEDDLGSKYFATSKGLTRVDKSDNYQIFTHETTHGALLSDSVTCLGLDRYRGLWIGTSGGGLHVYDNGRWIHYTRDSTRSGLPDDGVLSLAVYREERWVGTRNGFAQLRNNVWTTYTGERIAGRLPHRAVTAIAVDSSGSKWLGTLGGLVKFSGSSWTQYTVDNTQGGLPHNGISYLVVDSSNSLWVGTQAGIARRSADGKWTNFKTDLRLHELAGELTYSISLGSSGEVWGCFKGGVARFNGDKIDLFTKNTVEGLLTRFIYYVMPGRDGGTWFATEKGVLTMYPPLREQDE